MRDISQKMAEQDNQPFLSALHFPVRNEDNICQ